MKKHRVLSILLCALLIFSMVSIGDVYAGAQEEAVGEQKAALKAASEVISEEELSAQEEPVDSSVGDVSDEKVNEDTPEDSAVTEEVIIPQIELLQSGDTLDFINQAINKALEQTVPDMDSVVMEEFLQASDAYDELVSIGEEIPDATKDGMLTVRARIYEVIHSDQGVTASASSALERIWFIKTNVEDASTDAEVLTKAAETYPGCSPVFMYHKSIYYTDIRTGQTCKYPAMVSLTFPVPEGYDSAVNPKVLSYINNQLNDLSPTRDTEGFFFVSSARTLTDLCILDTPIALTGISMEKIAKVNRGQTITMKVSPVPAKSTQSCTITWKSSNTAIAKVSSSGVVTAVKEGTATITAEVKENTALKATCQVTVVRGSNALKRSVEDVMKETKAYMLSIDKNPTVGSEWFVLGLARGGLSLDNAYFGTYYNHVANYVAEKKGKLTDSIKYTEYSKTIVSLTAIGKDASNVGGYNLLKPLADFEKVAAQGMNGPIWALIALNTNPKYTIPKDSSVKVQTTKDKLIDYIVAGETAGGGWNMIGNTGDPDLTGMAFQALAPYYQKAGYEDVTAAVDRALVWLSKVQNSTGGYSTMGVETAESCVQVITGLCALGIDPETDERFVKGGSWTIENLLSYHIKGSGFMHVKAGSGNNGGGAAGQLNGMATEQAYYGLVAYQRMKAAKTGLYDMSDLTVKPGGEGDGTGSGLEEPTPKPAVSSTPTPTPTNESTKGSTASGSTKKASGTTKKASSGNSTTKKSTSGKTTKSGWDFEADDYVDSADSSSSTVLGNEAKGSQSTPEVNGMQEARGRAIPWVATGIFLGAAGSSGGMFLYYKRKGRKES